MFASFIFLFLLQSSEVASLELVWRCRNIKDIVFLQMSALPFLGYAPCPHGPKQLVEIQPLHLHFRQQHGMGRQEIPSFLLIRGTRSHIQCFHLLLTGQDVVT